MRGLRVVAIHGGYEFLERVGARDFQRAQLWELRFDPSLGFVSAECSFRLPSIGHQKLFVSTAENGDNGGALGF